MRDAQDQIRRSPEEKLENYRRNLENCLPDDRMRFQFLIDSTERELRRVRDNDGHGNTDHR